MPALLRAFSTTPRRLGCRVRSVLAGTHRWPGCTPWEAVAGARAPAAMRRDGSLRACARFCSRGGASSGAERAAAALERDERKHATERRSAVPRAARRRRRSARGQRARQPPVQPGRRRWRAVRAAQRNCRTSGFLAAPAPTSNYAFDVNVEHGLARSERDDAPAGLHPRAGMDGAGVGRARAAGDARVVLLARSAQRRLHDGRGRARTARGAGDVHRPLAGERPRGGLGARRLPRPRASAGGAVDRAGAPDARDDGRGAVDDRRSRRHRGRAGRVGQPGQPRHAGGRRAGRSQRGRSAR